MANKRSVAFLEAGSWYHRVKMLKEDGTTRYSKKGGFVTEKEAEESYYKYEEEYKKAYRAYHVSSSTDFEVKDYLIYWLEEIYSTRVENTTHMIASYVLYDLIIPNMNYGMKLRYVNVEYLDGLLQIVSKVCESAGNKSRELFNIALKDAVAQGYLHRNPVPDTKPYRRRKPKIMVLSKERMKFFLEKASETNWYLEILLGLFMGLRKGEISGLKFGDFDTENRTVRIISCTSNGQPHSASSLNKALSKLCSRNGLPHLTVHSLRHMYATILTEQGVPLVKVSALLGYSSIHTTFKYYCEVMDEQERIINFMNDLFVPEGGKNNA